MGCGPDSVSDCAPDAVQKNLGPVILTTLVRQEDFIKYGNKQVRNNVKL